MSALLIKDAAQVVSPQPQGLRGNALGQLRVETEASIHIHQGIIQAIGPLSEVEASLQEPTEVIDVSHQVVIPGFVDSHSHLVFGGNRADEFAERCRGVSYTDIVCTFLPAVSFFLNIPYAPARRLIDAGCIPALATDFNPGSSMTLCMQLLLSMACTQMGLSVEEALSCATQNGAQALRKTDIGCLFPNWQADLLILNTDNYRNMAYFFGENHITTVIKKGNIVYQQETLK